MSTDNAWTDARRRIVAKTLFDVLKIEVAAAYASRFFAEVPIRVKIALLSLMIVTAILAFLLYPKEGD